MSWILFLKKPNQPKKKPTPKNKTKKKTTHKKKKQKKPHQIKNQTQTNRFQIHVCVLPNESSFPLL